jgi:O-antigen ligase
VRGEERAAEPAELRQPTAEEGRLAPYWLFAAHLWAVFALALSNILLGLTILAEPLSWIGHRDSAGQAFARVWRRAPWPLLMLGCYAGLLLISVALSLDPGRSARGLAELFNLSVLPLALIVIRGERAGRRVVEGVVLVAALSALLGLAQFLFGYGDINHRIRGSFSHYMTFSGVLLVADCLLLAQIAAGRARGGRSGALRWAALVVINVALLGSYTRSAWVGLAVALVLLVTVRAPRWLVALPAVGLLFVLLAPAPVLDRARSIVDLQHPSNIDRLSMARAGIAMIADRPVAGLGPEMVPALYPRYRVETAVRDNVPHLHNSFLHLAAERGLPSLAAYLALMAIVGAAAWRRFRSEGGFAGGRADLYLGALLGLLAFNVAGLFENNWGDTEVQRLTLFLLALPFVIAGQARPEGPSPALSGEPSSGR